MAFATVTEKTWSETTLPVVTHNPLGQKHHHLIAMDFTGAATLAVTASVKAGGPQFAIAGSPFNADQLLLLPDVLYHDLTLTPAGIGAGESLQVTVISWNEGDVARQTGTVTTTPGIPGFSPA